MSEGKRISPIREAIGWFSSNKSAQSAAIGAFIFMALVVILSYSLIPKAVELEAGQPAKVDIEAPRDVVNRSVTERLREEAGKQAVKQAQGDPSNYDISPGASVGAEDALSAIFGQIERARKDKKTRSGSSYKWSAAEVESIRGQLESRFGVRPSSGTLRTLLALDDIMFSQVKTVSVAAVGALMREMRIGEKDVEGAKAKLEDSLMGSGLPPDIARAAFEVSVSQVGPNLTLNPAKVERAREAAIRSVTPVMILKGQIIIRRGEIATEDHIAILKDLGILGGGHGYRNVVGIALICAVFLSILWVYLYLYKKDILFNPRLFLLLGSIIVLMVFVTAILTSIPWAGVGYLIPCAFGTMLIAALLDSKLALVAGTVFGLLAGLMAGGALGLAFISIVTGAAGVFGIARLGERSDIIRAGFIVGVTDALAIIGVALVMGDRSVISFWYLGLGNGILSTVLMVGFLPFFENLFRITSPIRLLELANPGQPLLRKLLMEAPGTYHHSIIVGNLAEAAASVIGGDSLLVRVGAYYHDIGKVKRPYFFVENQVMQENPHDRISPALSTLVIISHVKDGVELARRHNLPEAIVNIIREHQGTGLVSYFYHKAIEEAGPDAVDERDFRYPGPKPQSKESALIMLADAVEAAVRSLSNPTPGRVEGLVRKLIKERLADGQLDESPLTLRDLDHVARAFVAVLSGFFHARIEYPDRVPRGIEGKRA